MPKVSREDAETDPFPRTTTTSPLHVIPLTVHIYTDSPNSCDDRQLSAVFKEKNLPLYPRYLQDGRR